MRGGWLLLLAAVGSGCAAPGPKRASPYEAEDAASRSAFKRVRLPFPPGTTFLISQGAFGSSSHSEPGNEYSWDFDVPYGTPVAAVEAGRVLSVWAPGRGGACDPRLSEDAHNVQIEARDGTVAQYVHIEARVKPGDRIEAGQVLGVTAKNGWICAPQLHFGVYASARQLYASPGRRTLPLLFEGLPDGLARAGLRATVPAPPTDRSEPAR